MSEALGFRLRRAQLAVYQDFNEAFSAKGLRPADFAVLTVLNKNPGLKQSEVAEALGIQRANFVAIVDGLEQKGLAERRKSDTDRRVQSLFITEDGLAYLKEIRPIVQEHDDRISERLGGREARNLLSDLLLKLYESRDEE
ncbi:MarR family winged helix-turn-helix transcriptional regulator [Rhizobium halophytocola]|nr:MarR family transcriptional regulator [Rhizobium halophytocola]